MDQLLKDIAEWIARFESDFEELTKSLEKQLRLAEANLLRRVLADILPLLKIEDGLIKNTAANMARANMIERVFLEVESDDIQAIVKRYSEALLDITGMNAEYYILTGSDAEKVSAIAKSSELIRTVVGLDKNGNLLNNGYLYRLAKGEAVREQLRQYLLTSIASRQNVNAFQKGLKSLISGTKEIDGAIVGYWRRYAFDQFAQVREIDNLHFAEELGLKWFVYQGGVIPTSRDFCKKKNGRVYSDQEAIRDWPKDPDLIDKKTVAQYRPLIDRGRYNCRHFLMWISEERANELKQAQK
jgi:hypothetical protein